MKIIVLDHSGNKSSIRQLLENDEIVKGDPLLCFEIRNLLGWCLWHRQDIDFVSFKEEDGHYFIIGKDKNLKLHFRFIDDEVLVIYGLSRIT